MITTENWSSLNWEETYFNLEFVKKQVVLGFKLNHLNEDENINVKKGEHFIIRGDGIGPLHRCIRYINAYIYRDILNTH